MSSETYTLMGPDRQLYESDEPGQWGGCLSTGVYGRLDCPAAEQALDDGGYEENRVFFLTEEHAIETGFRPCGRCCPERYKRWKQHKQKQDRTERYKEIEAQ